MTRSRANPSASTERSRPNGDRGKRLFDIAVSVAALVVCFPVLALVSLLVWLTSPGPVFFVQTRLGRKGRLFRLYKFRTMTDRPRVPDGPTRLDDPEVTAVGRILRRFKIDEFPQFWNVLKGDMSIVGPRPGMPSLQDDLDEVGRERLEVRPGLTGLAQVHGGICLSWPERWKYDAEYVRRRSLLLDFWILWKTLPVVIAGENRFVKRLEDRPESSCSEGESYSKDQPVFERGT